MDLPHPRARIVLPEHSTAEPCADAFNQWLKSPSLLLLISGPPGAGKSSALEDLKRMAKNVQVDCIDDFPRSGQGLSDISLLLQAATNNGATKLAIATQIRANDSHTGIISYLTQNYGSYDPWVIALEPISIQEIAAMAESDTAMSSSVGIQALLRIDRSGHDTRFLRTPIALAALLDARTSKTTISAVVDEFVMNRSMRAKIENLNPIDHQNLLGRVCFHHFLGMGDAGETAIHSELRGIPERAVSLDWLSQRITSSPDSPGRSNPAIPDARIIAEQSPFLTFQLEPSSATYSEVSRVILPDTLSYEYFVARGFLNSIRADEEFTLAKKSLADLSDGMIVIFIQAKIDPGDYPRLAMACQQKSLDEHNRMLFLHLLEDWPTFGMLLRESPSEYSVWLKQFVKEAPNVFCWKMAAFQLLTLGEFELNNYLNELRKESPDDLAFESELLSLRGSGDISRLLMARMRGRDLHRCRGVTAVRMGKLGSLECVVAIGEAIADKDNTDLETRIFLDELSRLVVRHTRD